MATSVPLSGAKVVVSIPAPSDMLLPLPTTFIPSAASDGEIFPALASRYSVLLWSGCAILLVHTLIMLLGS